MDFRIRDKDPRLFRINGGTAIPFGSESAKVYRAELGALCNVLVTAERVLAREDRSSAAVRLGSPSRRLPWQPGKSSLGKLPDARRQDPVHTKTRGLRPRPIP